MTEESFVKKQFRAAHAMLDKLEQAMEDETMKYVTKANLEIVPKEYPTMSITQIVIPPVEMKGHQSEPFEHKLTIVVTDD